MLIIDSKATNVVLNNKTGGMESRGALKSIYISSEMLKKREQNLISFVCTQPTSLHKKKSWS